jgi:hypothetical protein
MENEFRKASRMEFELLHRLMGLKFPGRDELALMIPNLWVKTIDVEGSLELQNRTALTAPVNQRVPIWAEAKDIDGYTIHVGLHVVSGQPVELEIYKDDGSPVRQMPPPSAFELVVLPPMPQDH